MHHLPTLECQAWLAELKFELSSASPSALEAIALSLKQLGERLNWAKMISLEAGPGEESLYLLAQLGIDGPALYLVSDGAGVRSPPHEHRTWAAIAGLRGIERNTFYEVTALEDRRARAVKVIDIRAGEYVALAETVVHATEVTGPESTLHLHLYGKPLHCLPPFQCRVFSE